MSKHETWMVLKYWDEIGGTLIEEYPIVRGNEKQGKRHLDGLIILGTKKKRLPRASSLSIEGKDVVVLQAKNNKLGMSLMGQTLFSKKLVERLKPKSVKSVALCIKDDELLRPMLEKYKMCKVKIYDKN